MKEQDIAKKQLLNGLIGLCQETAGFEILDTERHQEMLDQQKLSGHVEKIVDRVPGPLTMYYRIARFHNPTQLLLRALPLTLLITAYGATLPLYRQTKRPLLTGIDNSTPGLPIGVTPMDQVADAIMVHRRGRFTRLFQRSFATVPQSLRIATMAPEYERTQNG